MPPYDWERDFVRPTAAVINEIEGNVTDRIDDPPAPEPVPDPKRKTAWERLLEDHPVFDRPWWKPSLPRIPSPVGVVRQVGKKFAGWFLKFAEWLIRLRNR